METRNVSEQVPSSAIAEYLQAADKIGRHVQWYYDFSKENQAAAPSDSPATQAVAASGFVLSLLCLMALAFREAQRKDFPTGQEYWPISLWKFTCLLVLTGGLYTTLWAWRAFRQQRVAHNASIWPFWRAVFLPLWLIPAFVSVNALLKDRRLPMWIGIGAAVAYLASWVVAMLSDLLFGADGEPIWLFPVELLVDGLAAVPFVIAVNRLNGDRPENQKRNSAISRWDAMGVATSLIFLISTAYLSYDEAQLVAEAEAYSAAP